MDICVKVKWVGMGDGKHWMQWQNGGGMGCWAYRMLKKTGLNINRLWCINVLEMVVLHLSKCIFKIANL